MTPVVVISRCINSPADPQGTSASRVLVCGIGDGAKEMRGGLCGAVMVVLLWLPCSWPTDADGMCEWVTLSLLFFSLSVSFSHTHLIHLVTLLALTRLQPPLCFSINGLNRPPTVDLWGLCVCVWRGEIGRSLDCSLRPLLKRTLCPSD